MLCPGIFEEPALVEELHSLVAWSPLVPLYSTELPFAAYMQRCPNSLHEQGLFKIMFDKWPESAKLRKVAADHSLSKLAEHEALTRSKGQGKAATGATIRQVVQRANVRYVAARISSRFKAARPLLKARRDARLERLERWRAPQEVAPDNALSIIEGAGRSLSADV